MYVEIVENCSKASLMPIIQGKILEGSTIHTDGWKAYDGLVLNGYDQSLDLITEIIIFAIIILFNLLEMLLVWMKQASMEPVLDFLAMEIFIYS